MGLFMLIATWKGTVMIVGALAIALLSGCMQIMGAEHLDMWGLKMDASHGLDLNAGYNSISRVDNRRGVGER